MSAAPEPVPLRGGLVVPQTAIDLLNDLERRGVEVGLGADGQLVCRPGQLLTDDDRAAITAHRDALTTLVAYCERIQ